MNWDRLIDNKNADSQVLISNDIILNIFRIFVSNKYVACDDKDPVWMNENMKSKIEAKIKLYQVYVQKGRQETDFYAFEESVRNLNDLILQNKTSYYENLGKSNTPVKKVLVHIKRFYNGKRVPVAPPLLVNNNFVTDFKAKASFFSDFFSKQCTTA